MLPTEPVTALHAFVPIASQHSHAGCHNWPQRSKSIGHLELTRLRGGVALLRVRAVLRGSVSGANSQPGRPMSDRGARRGAQGRVAVVRAVSCPSDRAERAPATRGRLLRDPPASRGEGAGTASARRTHVVASVGPPAWTRTAGRACLSHRRRERQILGVSQRPTGSVWRAAAAEGPRSRRVAHPPRRSSLRRSGPPAGRGPR